MDFMHDVLSGGRTIRVFTLIDVCTRECVALHVAKSFTGDDVAHLREAMLVIGAADCRAVIQCDNGTEFTSTALDHWAYWESGAVRLQPAGKADRQRLHRERQCPGSA